MLFYQLLTGWLPPNAAQRSGGTPLNPPRSLNAQVSPLAEQAALRSLELKKGNRYQAAREMRQALETVQMMAGRSLGLSEEEVLALLAKMLAEGRIRRIGAVIRHRRLGYEANAMAVWDVPDAQVGEIGRALGRDPCVTLCYRRARALPHWRYNLYCMVHGKQRGQVLRQLAQMDAVRPFPGEVLFSTRCFSQSAARYG